MTDLTPAEALRTMGNAQKNLLHRLVVHGPASYAAEHPSTRDALITRGLAERHGLALVETGLGHDTDALANTTCVWCTAPAPADVHGTPTLFGRDIEEVNGG